MRYRVTHKTHYTYSRPVSLCYNLAHLRPRNFARQTCAQLALEIGPSPTLVQEWEDFFGNQVTHFAIQQPHESLTVTAISEVQVYPSAPLSDPTFSMAWEAVREYVATGSNPEALETRQYVLESPFVCPSQNPLADYARPSFSPGRPLLEAVQDLMQRMHREFTYDPGFSTLATPLLDVLQHRRGVCQDFAHLGIGCLRSQGLAARYVSGYLETQPPPGQPRLAGADATHAWFSVYVPDWGWVDFDPTNNQIPMDRHITTAWGRDYGDVTPLKGVIFGGGSHKLAVAVDVERIEPVVG